MKLTDSDLNYILSRTESVWEDLRGQRLFISGGTGFFGSWLLESFLWANKKLALKATAVVLTRDVASFKLKRPHLFNATAVSFHQGDVTNFSYPPGDFTYVIHAATDVCASSSAASADATYATIIQGTHHMLNFAQQANTRAFLLTSSGAVYGRQPNEVSHISEDFNDIVSDDTSLTAYARGKRQAEKICQHHAKQTGLAIKIARCFTFVGPYLPLDTHFAIGNFIHDRISQTTINVKGDGNSYRSYLYAADLTLWLWTILFRGQSMRPYNVGSDEALSIKELALKVARNFDPQINVQFNQSTAPISASRYVPDITRAKQELGLSPGINLDQAISQTIDWYTPILEEK